MQTSAIPPSSGSSVVWGRHVHIPAHVWQLLEDAGSSDGWLSPLQGSGRISADAIDFAGNPVRPEPHFLWVAPNLDDLVRSLRNQPGVKPCFRGQKFIPYDDVESAYSKTHSGESVRDIHDIPHDELVSHCNYTHQEFLEKGSNPESRLLSVTGDLRMARIFATSHNKRERGFILHMAIPEGWLIRGCGKYSEDEDESLLTQIPQEFIFAIQWVGPLPRGSSRP